ncbi:hypothetical protein RMN56_20635 [Micromonospora halotolerans]|uniref:DNA binding HTH domain-containing protein n=1 Tax=Micromonospora halotolerans TaxID=709879 RepID=A0ABY9ZQJ0_9ACTN|nr:hypothetical protein [Micromonospora halotolerans]WNM37564.1 hypothetical protein RMN56_20635 [Micromonospora halotolerans]
MALIYAFEDEDGSWHGNPGRTYRGMGRATYATLTFCPGPAEPGADSSFAGQTLRVAVASIDEQVAGEIAYRLDNGTVHYATDEVDELLFGIDVHRLPISSWPPVVHHPVPAAPATPAEPDPTPLVLSWEVSDAGRHYTLTLTRGMVGPTVEVTGADTEGQLIAQLAGHLPGDDLSLVARVFLAAVANPGVSTRVPAARRPRSWSEQETAYVASRHRDGADAEAIAVELGRTANSIRYKLHALGLAPFPGPNTSRPPAPPRTPAYTMEDLRQVHSNSHRPWEPEDDERLARRAAEGASISELMEEFGRNHGAITSRLARVQPPVAPSPPPAAP